MNPESLEEILNDDLLREKLRTYLQGHLAEESLLFYESVEKFEALADQGKRDEMGIYIINNFVIDDSLYWINISAQTRRGLLNVQVFGPETFDFAKAEIYRLLASNFYHSFVKTLKGPEPSHIVHTVPQGSTNFQNIFQSLARLNTRAESFDYPGCECTEEDIENNNICDIRKNIIRKKLEENRPQHSHGHPIKFSKLLRRASGLVRRRSSTATSGNVSTIIKAKRTKNAFRRIFGVRKHKKTKEMSFWEKFE